jgi:histidyl-tRNA synthetase
VVEHFGYEAYDTSILEPTELYKAKTSEEIVNEQTYTFLDRGGRSVTLRPEMTPSVARLVAKRRRELPFPLRWYSLPTVFRYERPQRGRLREHRQLNCDLFGISSVEGDIEIILLAYELMCAFGARETDFQIRINHRGIITEILTSLAKKHKVPFEDTTRAEVLRLMDRREKMEQEDYASALRRLLGDAFARALLKDASPKETGNLLLNSDSGKTLLTILEELEKRGLHNVVYDPRLVRGFDYYTGMVFEVFDTNRENSRSLFGGGRYDALFSLFGQDPIPTVGFGMGDVTLHDFLETHHLLAETESPTLLYIGTLGESTFPFAAQLAQRLRRHDLTVAVDFSGKKIGEQVKTAQKKDIPFFLAVGEEEMRSGSYTLKHLPSAEKITIPEHDIAHAIWELVE